MNPVNSTQLELVAQLTQLNKQLELFIKGDADTTIATNGGLIKSIAGISRDLNQFRYVQKVIDHRLYSDMISADNDIENGMLVRIWGDNTNGIYRKNGSLDYSKVSYSDLYDLRDFLPNPWNYVHITKTDVEFDQDLALFTYRLPASADKVIGDMFEGTFRVTSSVAGNRGSYAVKFIIHLATNPSGQAIGSVSLVDMNTIDMDTGFATTFLPQITIDSVSNVLNHTFTVNISVPMKNEAVVPCALDMKLYHIDASKYKLL